MLKSKNYYVAKDINDALSLLDEIYLTDDYSLLHNVYMIACNLRVDDLDDYMRQAKQSIIDLLINEDESHLLINMLAWAFEDMHTRL